MPIATPPCREHRTSSCTLRTCTSGCRQAKGGCRGRDLSRTMGTPAVPRPRPPSTARSTAFAARRRSRRPGVTRPEAARRRVGFGISRSPAKRFSDCVGHLDDAPRDRERAHCRLDDSSREMRMVKQAHKLPFTVADNVSGSTVRVAQTARRNRRSCGRVRNRSEQTRFSAASMRLGISAGRRCGGTAIDKVCRTSRP
jgi:hypothetical protein